MEVILLQKMRKLGDIGDTVVVKPGYGRNYLLPQGFALRATQENLKVFEERRQKLQQESDVHKSKAQEAAEKSQGRVLYVIRQASNMGQLYGSVSARDLSKQITEEGIEVEKRCIRIDSPIRTVGIHSVIVHLHPEVEVSVTLSVAPSLEEAKKQWEKKTAKTSKKSASKAGQEEEKDSVQESHPSSEQV